MKKIDLHIHTVSTASDHCFDFSIAKLKEYVRKARLDCIAVTNHNIFDLNQFTKIKSQIPVVAFPGIEIDLDGGQLLVIDNGTDLDDFNAKCQQVLNTRPTKKQPLAVSELQRIFGDLSKYLLIPHYDKRPQIREETLVELSDYISAGEVASPKKFMRCIKDEGRLIPVYFSDVRIEAALLDMPVRQTYIDCEEVTLSAIKACLRDKNKVALSPNDGNSRFQVFDDGQQLSTGLNVIIGERSSGKSHTLERIYNAVNNTKYIPQFSLVARDEKDDERRFNKLLSERNSLLSRDFLDQLQHVILDVVAIDLEEEDHAIAEYVESLCKFAKEAEMHDAFSRASLFSEEPFSLTNQNGLRELIDSTQNLIENVEFKATIEKHVSLESLKQLIVELMREHGKRELEGRKRKWVNDLIHNVKKGLQFKTSAPTIEDIDLYEVAMKRVKIGKFIEVVKQIRREREIERKSTHAFEIVATTKPFLGAGELKALSKTNRAFRAAFQEYDDPYNYLRELKQVDGVEEADLHKFFVKIEYKILNRDGVEVSGGERSEFNLLEEIQNARQYEMLLIDEPESSFDNLFLRSEVNEIIKDLSRNMPVVLVTHNNTVGASIKPDYLIYTKKGIVEGKAEYTLYSGSPTNKRLRSRDGKDVGTWEVTMGCLEAGHEAYDDRRRGYEDIKN